jgi:hypothetical protein
MLYYVSSFRYGIVAGSLEADFSTLIAQLRRVWAKDRFLKNHVLESIVRLTVETNLATSKDLRGIDVMAALPLSHARSASVSVVSLIMIVVFPVSGPANLCVKCISVEIDAPNVGQLLLFVPVCIFIHLYLMRYIFMI